MSKQLIIMRHAKSDWFTDSESDLERPLNRRGLSNAKKMGNWLISKDYIPQVVITSPATRAQHTKNAVMADWQGFKITDTVDDQMYLANSNDLQHIIRRTSDDCNQLMIIGHNPGLEDFLEYLLDYKATRFDDGKLLPTSAVAVLLMPDSWSVISEGCASIISHVRPSTITSM